MFKKQKKMTVMDFTGIYENENFYKPRNAEWLDFRELQGVYYPSTKKVTLVTLLINNF